MNKHKALLLALAKYYREQMDDERLSMFAEDLSDLSIEELALAIKHAKHTATRMPFPSQLRAFIGRAQISNEDRAQLISSDILAAISKFGYTNPEKAKEFIGEAGWLVVQTQGGWSNLCSLVDDQNFTTFRAQLRGIALSVLNNKHNFTQNEDIKSKLKLDFGSLLRSLN